MKTEYIYLVFSKTGTWLSRSIGLVTRSPFTHVALSFDDKFDNLYSFGRVNPNNPFSGGFVIESLYDGVYKRSSEAYCAIYKIPITSKQLIKLKEELNKFIYSDIAYKYNFLGLFSVLFHKPYERKSHYFCSQFITKLLSRSNIWHSSKPPGLTRPMDLLLIENKDLIFTGYVAEISIVEKTFTA